MSTITLPETSPGHTVHPVLAVEGALAQLVGTYAQSHIDLTFVDGVRRLPTLRDRVGEIGQVLAEMGADLSQLAAWRFAFDETKLSFD